MQVANPFAHLIEQLDGPGRVPIGFIGFGKSVHVYRFCGYVIDFKGFMGHP